MYRSIYMPQKLINGVYSKYVLNFSWCHLKQNYVAHLLLYSYLIWMWVREREDPWFENMLVLSVNNCLYASYSIPPWQGLCVPNVAGHALCDCYHSFPLNKPSNFSVCSLWKLELVCIRTHTHVKDLVVHVRVWWITETWKDPSCLYWQKLCSRRINVQLYL